MMPLSETHAVSTPASPGGTSPSSTSRHPEEWGEARRYIGLDFLAEARVRVIHGNTPTPA
ncbi:hypothetical protein SAMN05444920_103543 [Nonomuraea solani]|uniref:Uncharacterized protein n=1 Tax=Nonomuraea solani TaxID=1144553 RepID=A0A1H6BPF5_9ACTN|nr:hypothetical protein SAMN05444920_103543 [Nonomuraea solani]